MKKKNTNQPAPFKLTEAESTAVSSALDFLMNCDHYTYDNTRFDHNDAMNAAWAADDGVIHGKRREVRAVAAAIEFSLHCLANDPEAVTQVEQAFPDVIPDLKSSVPVMESLRTRLAAYAAKLTPGK